MTRQELNRATLARQLLLRRESLPAAEAVERLAGLNAQDPKPPYLSLWARLEGFTPEALTRALYEREVVRSSMMRATQHMVTASDYLAWRPVLQPVLDRIQRGFFGKATAGVDLAELLALAREALEGTTLTRPELGKVLARRWPERDRTALAWSVQLLLPLIHPPPSGTWGKWGATPFTLAEQWLGRPLATVATPEHLIVRYLAAFGPATVKDAQAWSGLTRLREPMEALDLARFTGEDGQELFDLSDAPRPGPQTAAPVRFLPEVDNLMLGHADRRRFMTDEIRKRVCIGAVVKATILVDGEVHGIWRIGRDGQLEMEFFRSGARAEIDDEASNVVAWQTCAR